MTLLLELDNVWVSYGNGTAFVIKGVSLRLAPGEIVAVLGANGAGKTTLLRAISGILPLRRGTIRMNGVDISAMPASRRVELGLVHVPEGRQILAGLSVEENLLIGGYVQRRRPAALAKTTEEVFSMFPILKDRRKQLAGSLSGGQQQMLALGRALMAKPSVLMCDEPSLGLAPLVVEEIFMIIGRLRNSGVPILLVEQNAKKALEIADRGIVIKRGEVALSGSAHDMREDPEIASAYLGASAATVSR